MLKFLDYNGLKAYNEMVKIPNAKLSISLSTPEDGITFGPDDLIKIKNVLFIKTSSGNYKVRNSIRVLFDTISIKLSVSSYDCENGNMLLEGYYRSDQAMYKIYLGFTFNLTTPSNKDTLDLENDIIKIEEYGTW
ncbi:MAG: hypothetical protein ACI35S_00765 [Anaeroplasma sp.]